MPRPLASENRDTRREILDAALDLFAERGFPATSVRRIARAVGVRESALYHHFASKEAILEAVIEERARLRVSIMQEEIAAIAGRSLTEILTRLAERGLAQLSSPKELRFMRLALSLGAPGLEAYSPLQRMLEARVRFERLIATLQEGGLVRRDLDLETFMLHFAAPLLIASGAIFPVPGPLFRGAMKPFIRAHVAFLVRAIGTEARGARGRR